MEDSADRVITKCRARLPEEEAKEEGWLVWGELLRGCEEVDPL